jgi:hypothetical protein
MSSLKSAQESVQNSDVTLSWWAEETLLAIAEAEVINDLVDQLDPEDINSSIVIEYLKIRKKINYLTTKGNYELRKRHNYEQKLSKRLIDKIFNGI